jgi:hypothetical protein
VPKTRKESQQPSPQQQHIGGAAKSLAIISLRHKKVSRRGVVRTHTLKSGVLLNRSQHGVGSLWSREYVYNYSRAFVYTSKANFTHHARAAFLINDKSQHSQDAMSAAMMSMSHA